jgi:hypothetical protein
MVLVSQVWHCEHVDTHWPSTQRSHLPHGLFAQGSQD